MAKKAKVKLMKGVEEKLKPRARVKLKSPAVKRKKRAKVKTSKVQKANFADTSVKGGAGLDPSSLLDVPMGEQLDVRQEAVSKIPDIQSVFDIDTGFGVANPGETGTAAIDRIKKEQGKKKKAKVKKRK